MATASLTAKTLFLASAHDEFEMLDFNRDWVHVRISGLSRGWIWRDSLEMPDSVPAGDAPPSPVPVAAEVFHMSREESAPFPGDWAPLRGKYVKIVSVEKINEAKEEGPAPAGVREVRPRQRLCGFGAKGAGTCRDCCDLRFGRRRDDCCCLAVSPAMEGRKVVRRSVMAPMFF